MKQILSIVTMVFAVILLSGQGAQAQDDWTQKSPAMKPSARSYHAMASLGGDQVLLFGGYNGYVSNDETWVYDLSDNSWTLKGPARPHPRARFSHAMASLGGDQVLLFGGSDPASRFDDETWVYDLSDNAWKLKSPARKPSVRYGHAMASLGGDKVLLFGGFDPRGYDDETWVYDLSDNTWTLKSPATKPSWRFGHAMAYLGGDQVLLFGGAIYDDETWVYDLSDNTWTLKSPARPQPSARYDHAMASLGAGDQVLLLGGADASGLDDETWVYDLSDNSWTLKSPATQLSARYGHAMASLGGDQVLLFGGIDPSGYDDETWVYSVTPIPCADITSMAARCIGGERGTIQVRVNLVNALPHAGETITIAVDGTHFSAAIITNGVHTHAQFSIPGSSVGDHAISLVDPAGCLADVHAECGGSDGITKADPYWDDDAEWTAPLQDTPQATQLLGNYPNPFNPSTTIRYALPEKAHVKLEVFNMLGQSVAVLVDEEQNAGYHDVVLEGKTLASGLYIYRISARGYVETKKLLLLK